MKRWLNARITLAMAAALAVALVLAAANPATAPPRDAPPSVAPINEDVVGAVEDAAPGGAGLRVYLDPATGLLRNRPTDPEAEEIIRDAAERLNTYGADLLQEPLPQGGFKVDLRGRFQSAVVATIDPRTDEVKIDCISTPASKEVDDEG